MSAGLGNSGVGLGTTLTPYQVSLCCLLTQYAQVGQDGRQIGRAAERRLFNLLFREIQASRSPKQKALREIRDELCADAFGEELWESFLAQLRSLDSPDSLFDAFQALEEAIAREVAATSPLHASGIFGQFARCAVLAFKDASFEATVRLFDLVAAYVEAFEKELEDEIVAGSHRHQRRRPAKLEEECSPRKNALEEVTLGTSQLEELAQALVRDLPTSFGQVPFPVVDKALATLHGMFPLCHVLHFLRYVNCLQHRMVDDAASSLRSFHDGLQHRGFADFRTAAGWPLGLPPEDGLPDLVQHASLALAGLQTEMRHLDDAVQAICESIQAAQEASDGGCLCACLYMLSLVQMQAGHADNAFTMMRRCLHGAEAKGLPMLQALCCLGIARALSTQPALSDRRKRGLLWKESISRMAAQTQPQTAALRTQGAATAGGSTGTLAGGGGSVSMAGGRGFGLGSGGAAASGPRGGLGVLAALLGHGSSSSSGVSGSDEGSAMEGAACRDAFAHITLASHLSTQPGILVEARPRVLLCQAEVARLFGLQPLTAASCGLVLDIYRKDLAAEDRALALCQLASAAAERSLERARPLLQDIAQELPQAGHLWAHIVGPRVLQSLIQAGECETTSALLFQVAGVVRTVPHGTATQAAQRLRVVANGVRLYHRQLLAAYRSAREVVEMGPRTGAPGDVCCHLLCLADVHLEAQDPVGALGPCLRCLSAAENARLLHFRAEALVRLARIKLEMRDLPAALHLAEEVTPQLSTSGSARLRGDALLVQADVLLALAAKHQKDDASHVRLLKEVASVLEKAAEQFEVVAELNPLRRCRYLLARTYHQLGDIPRRNACATSFRQISEFFDGCGSARGQSISWESLGLTSERSRASEAEGHSNLRADLHLPPPQIPSTPPSRGPGNLQQGLVSARPARTLGSTGAAAVGAGPFKAATPFTYAFDTVESAREGQAGSKQGDSASDQLSARCPALAQLLTMAEAAHGGEGEIGVAAQTGSGSPLDFHMALSGVGSRPADGRDSGGGVQTVVGTVRSLYPMAAVLGA